MKKLQKKRVYDEVEDSDGYRILVDRLWPRGVKKEDLPYDLWPKNITPSNHIRKEFNHEEDKFDQFRTNYLNELAENDEADEFLKTVEAELEDQNVTLLYAAKDRKINHVVVLMDWLEEQLDNS